MTDRSFDPRPGGEIYRPLRHIRPLSWEAIAAGVFMALAVQVLLGLFGTGAGLAAVDMTRPAGISAGSAGAAAAMWGAVSILVSLFYGGFIAARLSVTPCRHEGVLRGLVVWCVSAVLVVALLSSGAGHLLSGAGHVIGGANMAMASGRGHAAARNAQTEIGDQAASSQGMNDLLQGANGAPMSPDQAKADMAVQSAVMAEGGDGAMAARQRLVADIESQGVQPADAEQRVTAYQQKMDAAKDKAKVKATEAAHAAAKAAFGAAVVLLLSALTAAIGGALGAAHVHDRHKHHLQSKEATL